MQLSQLQAFQAVVETGSVTAAAHRLNRVPSGISIRIQQLESALECSLFIRDRKRMVLSPSGRALLPRAQQILELSDGLRTLLHEDDNGLVTIGALDVALTAFMPSLVGRFRERHQAQMDIRCEVSEVLVTQVSSGELDIAITDGPPSQPSIESAYAFTEELVLTTEKHHPAVSSPADLRCRELYGFRRNCSYRLRMDQWLSSTPSMNLPIIEMESYQIMLACVSAGTGAAWMPRSLLESLPGRENVRMHSLGELGQSDLYFIWQQGQLTPGARRLLGIHRADDNQAGPHI